MIAETVMIAKRVIIAEILAIPLVDPQGIGKIAAIIEAEAYLRNVKKWSTG